MPSNDQLAFLHASLERWRAQGLIDEATYQRLHADASTDTPPALFAAGGAAEIDRDLATEVALHIQLDAEVTAADRAASDERAAADRVPVAERPAGLGHALLAAAADIAATPAADESAGQHATRAAIEQRILAHDARTAPPSLWASAVRPFLVANAMWLAGALLIIAGSIYFLRLAWDHLSSVPLHLVVAGVLHGYAAAFFATGYLLSRKQEAHGVGRILFAFACAILPLGSVAVGELVVVALNA